MRWGVILAAALAVLALIAWLAKGGKSAPLSETTMKPALVIVCICAIAVVAMSFILSPMLSSEVET